MKAKRKNKRTAKATQAPKKPRATDAQVRARVEELLRIRLDGAELWDLREYVREKNEKKDPVWGEEPFTDSQLYRYLQRADALVAESCKGSRKKIIKRHLAQRRSLYARAVSSADVRTALAVLDSEAKLLDLFPRPEDDIRRQVEELEKQMAELRKDSDHGNGNPTRKDRQAPPAARAADGADRATADAAAR